MPVMWMMGYNDEGDLYMADSFNGRKFRPLIPRPISSAAPNCGGNDPGVTLPPCLGHLHHGADVFSLNPNHIGILRLKQFNFTYQHFHKYGISIISIRLSLSNGFVEHHYCIESSDTKMSYRESTHVL